MITRTEFPGVVRHGPRAPHRAGGDPPLVIGRGPRRPCPGGAGPPDPVTARALLVDGLGRRGFLRAATAVGGHGSIPKAYFA
jgi:hypothetical protein